MEVPAKSEFPGTGTDRQRHLAEHEEPGRLDAQRQVGRLHGVPPARHQGHARNSRRRSARSRLSVAAWERRVQSGQAGAQMSNAAEQSRPRARVLRCSPTGPIGSRPAKCRRAPPRPQGIERNVVITQWDWADPKAYLHDVVSTDRRNPTRQRERAGLRRARAERRLPAGARSGRRTRASRVPLTVRDPNTPPTGADDAGAVAVLGRRGDLDEQEQRAQPDARREGTGLDHVGRAAAGESGLLQGRVRATRRRSCSPSTTRGPPSRGVRSEDEEADAHQHLLRHAPPDVRRGRESHAVDERRRAGGRLAEHEDVRRDAATR